MTSGFSWFIAIVALANVAGAMWLLFANGRAASGESGKSTTHVWDGDLTEFNNPLPRWWFWLFVLTTVWGLGYLVFYPGLGSYTGTLGWTQACGAGAAIADHVSGRRPAVDFSFCGSAAR